VHSLWHSLYTSCKEILTLFLLRFTSRNIPCQLTLCRLCAQLAPAHEEKQFKFLCRHFKATYTRSKIHSFLKRLRHNREIANTIHTIHWINFSLLSSFKIKTMVTTKIKETTTTLRFLPAHNSRNPSFGHTKSLFIQKKQTNYYLIVVTLRLGLISQVMRAHFVSMCVIFPLLFSIASKYRRSHM
jgi:hypothetical protein